MYMPDADFSLLLWGVLRLAFALRTADETNLHSAISREDGMKPLVKGGWESANEVRPIFRQRSRPDP
jgi:hypothetical protein